jgi:hypothetical protein
MKDSMNTPKERIAEYREIAAGVIEDLNAASLKFRVLALGNGMTLLITERSLA